MSICRKQDDEECIVCLFTKLSCDWTRESFEPEFLQVCAERVGADEKVLGSHRLVLHEGVESGPRPQALEVICALEETLDLTTVEEVPELRAILLVSLEKKVTEYWGRPGKPEKAILMTMLRFFSTDFN